MKIIESTKLVTNSILKNGFFLTLAKIYKKTIWKKNYASMLKKSTPEQRFSHIYNRKLWSTFIEESVSGDGSTLKNTEGLRTDLPMILEKYKISSILDVPCGDFNWMRKFLYNNNNLDLKYIGGDIVEELIKDNEKKYTYPSVSFMVIDLTKDSLPHSDLMIVRDCLFHLSFIDIESFMKNLLKSNIKYILTTTHVQHPRKENTDIITGDFRLIDIFQAPFYFPSSPLERIDDYINPPIRQMCLFKVSDLNRTLN